MTRETAAHVAELAALLAKQIYPLPNQMMPPYMVMVADAALALCREASKLHRIAERECNFAHACPACDGSGEVVTETVNPGDYAARGVVTNTATPCPKCAGTGSTLGRRAQRARQRVRETLAPFGLFAAFQTDPRGWPIVILASQADADSWSRDGSPRELLRVTPHA